MLYRYVLCTKCVCCWTLRTSPPGTFSLQGSDQSISSHYMMRSLIVGSDGHFLSNWSCCSIYLWSSARGKIEILSDPAPGPRPNICRYFRINLSYIDISLGLGPGTVTDNAQEVNTGVRDLELLLAFVRGWAWPGSVASRERPQEITGVVVL